jgi:hypothetical protein
MTAVVYVPRREPRHIRHRLGAILWRRFRRILERLGQQRDVSPAFFRFPPL